MEQHGGQTVLELRLHGGFEACWADGERVEIASTKARAILAVLAMSPHGEHERPAMAELLWGAVNVEQQQGSLRQAVRSLRSALGTRADDCFSASRESLSLRGGSWRITSKPADGPFLSGLNVPTRGFTTWVSEMRKSLAPLPAWTEQPAGQAHAPNRDLAELRHKTVAVAPLRAEGGDTQLSAAGNFFAQDLARQLSRSEMIEVLSHAAARLALGTEVDTTTIRDRLDVDYLVCGSIRIRGDTFRVDVDFIEIATGVLKWSKSASGPIGDLVGGLPNTVEELVEAVLLSVARFSILPPTCDLRQIGDRALRTSGLVLMHRTERRSFLRAKAHFEELAKRRPNADTQALLAHWHVLEVQQGWSTNLASDIANADICANRALDFDSTSPAALAIAALVAGTLRKRPDEADALYKEAAELEPAGPLTCLLNGTQHAFTGDGATAMELTERARTQSPLDPTRYYFDALAGTACLAANEPGRALKLAEQSLRANPRHISTLRVRTIALQQLDRGLEARRSAQELRQRDPNFTVDRYRRAHPAADFHVGQDWAQALMEAGIPVR